MAKRSSITYLVQRGLKHPGRIFPYISRRARNFYIQQQGTDAVEFYRDVVNSDASRDPDRAVGSYTKEHWIETGQIHLDYLIKHDIKPDHRFLDLGCGNLRLGSRLIPYLDEGNYVGTDISPKILMSAYQNMVEFNLQAKRPYLYLIDGTNYDMFPDDYFDWVHAHSVFSHLPIEVIENVLVSVRRVMKPGGRFDFTYFVATDGAYQFLGEDYYFPTSQLIEVVERCGFTAEHMDDWTEVQGHQDKIRATKT